MMAPIYGIAAGGQPDTFAGRIEELGAITADGGRIEFEGIEPDGEDEA